MLDRRGWAPVRRDMGLSRWRQRTLLFATTALVGSLALAGVALADGGAGSAGKFLGGTGGSDEIIGPGGAGGNANSNYGYGGGGGGGAGQTGGAGGNGVNNVGTTGGTGGAGGATAGANGGGGNSLANSGGGGGAHGYVGANLPTLAVSGGRGGDGGAATFGDGGGGGAGGSGAFVTGVGVQGTLNLNVTGGRGGDGGNGTPNGGFYGGNGGSGGLGLQFTAAGATFTNNATISGGNGGAGSTGGNRPGTPGAGGIGIFGAGITITNNGTISGGVANAGAGARAYAIVLGVGSNFIGGNGQIIGGINVTGGASFQPALPGTAVGTPLAVSGPLVFANSSTYAVRITPKASDSVAVTGTASPGGAAVNVAAGNGTYKTRRYTILSATGGVTGTFSTVTTNLAFLVPTLTYDTNDVFLNITGNAANGTVDYTTAASTQNQYNLASGLTNAGMAMPGGAGGQVLGALNQLTVPQAQAAFDALSGEGITAAQNVANRSAQLFNGAIFDQTTFYGSGGAGNQITLTDAPPAFVALASPEQTLAAANSGQPIRELADLPSSHIAPTFVAPNRTWRAWASGFGGVEDIHGNAVVGSATQNNTIYGGTLGVDYQLTPNYLVGVALGGSDGEFQVPGRTTSGSTTGGHVAFYDLATFGAFYGASSNSFSYYDNKTTRAVAGFGGLAGETERGDFNSHEFRTRLEFGRHIAAYGATLTPFVALEIAELRSNGFGETSVTGPGLFRLNVSGQSAADVPAYVGARVQTLMPLGGLTLLPSLQVAYVHEFAPYRSQIGAIADLPGSTFLVTGAQPARDAAQVKAGGEVRLGPNTALFANFDGEFSGVSQLYAGQGGFKYLW